MPMAKLFTRFPYCIIVSLALQKERDDFSLCAISLIQEQSRLVLQEQNLLFNMEGDSESLRWHWELNYDTWALAFTHNP